MRALSLVIAQSTDERYIRALLATPEIIDQDRLELAFPLASMPMIVALNAPAVLLAFQQFAHCCADAYINGTMGYDAAMFPGPAPRSPVQ